MPSLAVRGGTPVRTRPWPAWPQTTPDTLPALEAVLHSGRWAISGAYTGRPSFERRFAAAFAEFHEVGYCIPTASGTASLMVALEAGGVGAGDEVIIPGLTWVANASTVAGVNAVPVLADVDPRTLCLDPAAVEAAIGPRTTAIVAVHLYSAVADLDALAAIADRHGLVLIEDCAQAHGARYRDRRVGSFGRFGAFSMQQTKPLTSGEGGAVVTDDAELARAAEELRADGRSYPDLAPAVGALELVESARLMGSNRALSEFQAAILLAQLPALDQQNATRRRNLTLLDALLRDHGFMSQQTSAGTTARTVYEFPVLIDEELAGSGLDVVARALTAELGTAVEPGYPPLNSCKLYQPRSRRRFAATEEVTDRLRLDRYDLPVCTAVAQRLLTIHHSAFLGSPEDMHDIATAVAKVAESRAELMT